MLLGQLCDVFRDTETGDVPNISSTLFSTLILTPRRQIRMRVSHWHSALALLERSEVLLLWSFLQSAYSQAPPSLPLGETAEALH